MKPAKPDRVGEATVDLPTLMPPELGATQQYKAPPIPPPHANVGDTARDSSQAIDPGATCHFKADEASEQSMVGAASSSGFRFRILRAHARGGLGQVSVAEDMELHREVALKEILRRHSGNTESQARFVMEAEITGGLEHPGIVPVYGLGTYADGRPFYAMRFIRGESLDDTIQKFHEAAGQRDPGKTAVELRQLIGRFIDVCNAIEYAHSRGILHRDIKPANIMLGKYGETLVVDWGIAKLMNQPEAQTVAMVEEGTLRPVSASDTTATQMGTTMGTPQYMSPEQAAGRLDLMGPPSDVYSLGATLYFMLTGQPAFDGNRLMEMLRQVQRGEFKPPRDVNKSLPRPLNAICLKALALEPEDRYASARGLSDDLEHWMADEPVVAYRENATERLMRWLRHHRSWAQASLITLLAVTAVSIVAALLVDQARQREVEAHEESERQRVLAVEAHEESERQRVLADESFRHARHAVDDFFTRVSESTLLDVPGMHPLRHDLLQVALDYEQKFLAQRGDDPTLRLDAAAAMFRVALVTGQIKSKAEALPLFEKARRIQEELLAADQANAALRYALSNSYNEMGRAHYEARRTEDAVEWFQKSLDLRERLVRDEPKNTEYQRKLAHAYNNVGVLAKLANRRDEALVRYRRANEIRETLVELDPAEPLFRRDLALGRYNLGVLAREVQDFEQAAASLKQAAEGYQALVADAPLVTEYRQGLATCFSILGDLFIQTNEYDAAVEALDNAREIQQRLASENPQLIEVAADLAGTFSNLAGLHERRNQLALSLPLVQQAVEVLRRLVETNPDATRFREYLASTLVRAGSLQIKFGSDSDAREALQEARDIYSTLVASEPQNPALRTGQGRCLNNLGIAQGKLAEGEQARQTLDKAARLFEELTEAHPEQAELKGDLALCYLNLGVAQHEGQDWDAAFDTFGKMRQIHEQFLKDDPAAPHHLQRLVETWLKIADVESQRDRPDESLAAYDTARDLAQKLIDPQGQSPAAWTLIAIVHHGRGSVLLSEERHQEALAAYQEAVDYQRRALETAPEDAAYRESLSRYYTDLALVQKQMGRTADAVATTLKRKPLWPGDALQLYQIARDLTLLAPPMSNDLSDTEKEARLKHLDLAISLLADAKRAGYADWDATEKDEAFAPLREQDAYRKLLSDE